MRRIVFVAAFAAGLASATEARADQFDFVNVLQQEPMKGGNLNAAWASSGSVLYQTVEKPGSATAAPGSGGGGGTGEGRKSYQGVQHKMYAYAGATRWLMLGVEQSMTTTSSDGWTLGVMAPEARFKLLSLESSPVGLSLYTGPRLRLRARRPSTAVAGVGLEAGQRSIRFASNAAFETSTADHDRENGLRYDLGVRFPIYDVVSGAVEAWGVAVWPDYAKFQTSHHVGPTVKVKAGKAWVAVMGMWGVKDLATKTFYDYGGMAQLGMAFL